jgi:glycosyltransferase involved in cell wall biosynthesis
VLTPLFHEDDPGAKELIKKLLPVSDAIIAQTEVERDELKKIGAPEERVHVLSAGPIVSDNAAPASFKEKYGIQGRMVLFLGRKEKPKGYHLILEAAGRIWKEFPETYFVFAGSRTTESTRVFSRFQDRRVIEIGELDPWGEEKSSALAACDVFCMPSVPECSGVVFLEAWSFGKPVIAADIPTEREFINRGVDGLLVERDPDDIARSILSLLRDDELRRMMGNSGRLKVEGTYSWDRIIETMNGIYRSVLEEKATRQNERRLQSRRARL